MFDKWRTIIPPLRINLPELLTKDLQQWLFLFESSSGKHLWQQQRYSKPKPITALSIFDVEIQNHSHYNGPPDKWVSPAFLLLSFTFRQRKAFFGPDQTFQFCFTFSLGDQTDEDAQQHTGPENNSCSIKKWHLRKEKLYQ